MLAEAKAVLNSAWCFPPYPLSAPVLLIDRFVKSLFAVRGSALIFVIFLVSGAFAATGERDCASVFLADAPLEARDTEHSRGSLASEEVPAPKLLRQVEYLYEVKDPGGNFTRPTSTVALIREFESATNFITSITFDERPDLPERFNYLTRTKAEEPRELLKKDRRLILNRAREVVETARRIFEEHDSYTEEYRAGMWPKAKRFLPRSVLFEVRAKNPDGSPGDPIGVVRLIRSSYIKIPYKKAREHYSYDLRNARKPSDSPVRQPDDLYAYPVYGLRSVKDQEYPWFPNVTSTEEPSPLLVEELFSEALPRRVSYGKHSVWGERRGKFGSRWGTRLVSNPPTQSLGAGTLYEAGIWAMKKDMRFDAYVELISHMIRQIHDEQNTGRFKGAFVDDKPITPDAFEDSSVEIVAFGPPPQARLFEAMGFSPIDPEPRQIGALMLKRERVDAAQLFGWVLNMRTNKDGTPDAKASEARARAEALFNGLPSIPVRF